MSEAMDCGRRNPARAGMQQRYFAPLCRSPLALFLFGGVVEWKIAPVLQRACPLNWQNVVASGRPQADLHAKNRFLMRYFVYVLQSDTTGAYYTGSSAAPDQRLASHNAGRVRSTKSARPWTRIHLEEFQDRQTAQKRERCLKSGYGRRWLLRHLNSEGW